MAFPTQAQTTNICDKTQEIQDSILTELQRQGIAVTACEDVTDNHLGYSGCTGNVLQTILVNQQPELTSLKAGDFAGLPCLSTLWLSNNQLDTLPDGIFLGLNKIKQFSFEGNPGSPFQLKFHLQVTTWGPPESFTIGSVGLVMPTGTFRSVTVPITIVGGTPTTGSLIIPAGGSESNMLRITRSEENFRIRTGEITLGGNDGAGINIVKGDRLGTITHTVIRIKVFLEGALE